ncbi:uncharacterized protein ARMOST_17136 [Armillaria ostoyae]|uniref:Uncharacterized protein n=1 Tax=Armillaria ostoyae TaxID=47428 RepID=A0A284RY71_ARMOS|nr:uncharacterized protein ARMOST_17136 [Armillaria ostoyae]
MKSRKSIYHEYRGALYIRKRSCFRVPRKSSRYIRSSLSFSPCRNYARQGGSSHEVGGEGEHVAWSSTLDHQQAGVKSPWWTIRFYKFVPKHCPQLGYQGPESEN